MKDSLFLTNDYPNLHFPNNARSLCGIVAAGTGKDLNPVCQCDKIARAKFLLSLIPFFE